MPGIFSIAFNVLLPVFGVIGVAVILGRLIDVDTRVLSKILIYLFSPVFTVKSLMSTAISIEEMGLLTLIYVLATIFLWLVGRLLCRALRMDERMTNVFLLTILIINAGNIGLPVSEFAFGIDGLGQATVVFVLTSIAANSIGIFLASRGRNSTAASIKNIFKVPLVYATLIGLVLNFCHVSLPLPLERTMNLLAGGMIPCALIFLGLQLSHIQIRSQIGAVLLASLARLALAPLAALLAAVLLGATGIALKVSVVQFSMPTALFTTALAAEFGSKLESEFTAAAILITTTLSLVSLSILLALLG